MAIKINDIPPEGLTIELAETIDLFDEETATSFSAVLTIQPAGGGVLRLSGTVESTPELACSRCLKRFPYPIKDLAMSLELVPQGALKLDAEQHELGRAELDVDFFEGDEIEPRDFIREQLLLDIPMVPLHSPDCKGLCAVCGTDLNVTACGCDRDGGREMSPFAALKKLKTPKE